MAIWDELAEHATLSVAHGRMLPAESYRSGAVLRGELTELFGREWLCVARTADVPAPGDYVVSEIPTGAGGARSIAVVRGDDSVVRVFDNVCVHRGAALLHGCGTERRITCPYHAWVYRLDGGLVGGPYMQQSVEADGRPFDPSAHGLGTVRSEVWEGFVFVNQDADAPPLSTRLHGLEEVVARYRMEGYVPVHREVEVWPTNWKLLVENFMDAYHVFKVHKATFAKDGDNTLDTTMYPGTDHWAHHRVSHQAAADMAHPDNTVLDGVWRKTLVLGAIFPGFVVQLQPNWLWYLQITPLGTREVRVEWRIAVAPEVLAAQDDPAAYVAGVVVDLVHRVNAEDKPVVRGLRSSMDAGQFARAPLSYLERNVYDFDRYVSSRLSGARSGAGEPPR